MRWNKKHSTLLRDKAARREWGTLLVERAIRVG